MLKSTVEKQGSRPY